LRGAADALGEDASVEAAWLRGAADLVERDQAERQDVRAQATWLEELASEARARKTAVLSAWVDAAEALRTAIHALESERGPLVESLFPEWRGASLRRHVDQARAAETELQRRLASGYVVRRLAELATHDALGAALEALAAAGTTWAADRDRSSLAGAEGEVVRTRLLALAGRAAHLLERVRWVVRAALANRLELIDEVFPRRRPAQAAAGGAPPAETDAPDTPVTTELAADASAPTTAPTTPRSKAARRGPARSDASATAPGRHAPAPSELAGPDTTPRGKLRSRRPGTDAARDAAAPGTAATDASSERTSPGRTARPGRTADSAEASPTDASSSRTTGRATRKPKVSPTSASDPAQRSTRKPKSATTSASGPAAPSTRRPKSATTPASGPAAPSTRRPKSATTSASSPAERSTRKPKSSTTSATRPAAGSARKPDSSAAAAPDPQPSARGSGRKPRPPRGS